MSGEGLGRFPLVEAAADGLVGDAWGAGWGGVGGWLGGGR